MRDIPTINDLPLSAQIETECNDCGAPYFEGELHLCDDFEQPAIDDTVYFCPDCERPNQFGELCPSCIRERGEEA